MSPQSPKPPAPKPNVDRRLAKDVARHLDRRRMRRKVFLWLVIIGAIVLAVMYLTCGRGWGLGGKGKGDGAGSGPGSVKGLLSTVDAARGPCQVRIAASGISIEGKTVTAEEAVAACKAEGAKVQVTGGARRSDRAALKAAFKRAEILATWDPPDDDEGSAGSGAGSGP
jgi:hypothetical protein